MGCGCPSKGRDIKISQGLNFHERPNEVRDEGIRAENQFILQCPCAPSEIDTPTLGPATVCWLAVPVASKQFHCTLFQTFRSVLVPNEAVIVSKPLGSQMPSAPSF